MRRSKRTGANEHSESSGLRAVLSERSEAATFRKWSHSSARDVVPLGPSVLLALAALVCGAGEGRGLSPASKSVVGRELPPLLLVLLVRAVPWLDEVVAELLICPKPST